MAEVARLSRPWHPSGILHSGRGRATAPSRQRASTLKNVAVSAAKETVSQVFYEGAGSLNSHTVSVPPWFANSPEVPEGPVAVVGAGVAGASVVRALTRRGVPGPLAGATGGDGA